eukprot:GSA120T00000293001.1
MLGVITKREGGRASLNGPNTHGKFRNGKTLPNGQKHETPLLCLSTTATDALASPRETIAARMLLSVANILALTSKHPDAGTFVLAYLGRNGKPALHTRSTGVRYKVDTALIPSGVQIRPGFSCAPLVFGVVGIPTRERSQSSKTEPSDIRRHSAQRTKGR